MMNPKWKNVMVVLTVAAAVAATGWGAEATVTTAVYSKTGNGYKRVKAKNGSFRPEYYALSNGGRIAGTVRDITVDRVTYEEVADIAMRVLGEQNYHYAQTKEQAKLLVVLQWGSTLAVDGSQKQMNLAETQVAMDTLATMQTDLKSKLMSENPNLSGAEAEGIARNTTAGFGPSITDPAYRNEHAAISASVGALEGGMLKSMVDNRARDELNQRNARVLGYMDDLADSNDIRRYAGGGDRYSDLIADVEESRYYIVISAYDFPELTKKSKQKLLWQTRVSVRSPGNAFDDSVAAMLKSASKHFGQNTGKLVRAEETKGTVEFGDLRFLGEAKEPNESSEKGAK